MAVWQFQVVASRQILNQPASKGDARFGTLQPFLFGDDHVRCFRSDALRAFLAGEPENFGEPGLGLCYGPGFLWFGVHDCPPFYSAI